MQTSLNFNETQRFFKKVRCKSGFRKLTQLQVTMVDGLISLGYSPEKIADKLVKRHEVRWQ